MKEVENILSIMKSKGLSSYKVSQGTNIAESTISRILTGVTKKPNASTVSTILAFVTQYNSGPNLQKAKESDENTIKLQQKLIEAHEDRIRSKDLEIQKLKKELEDCKKDNFFKNEPVPRDTQLK